MYCAVPWFSAARAVDAGGGCGWWMRVVDAGGGCGRWMRAVDAATPRVFFSFCGTVPSKLSDGVAAATGPTPRPAMRACGLGYYDYYTHLFPLLSYFFR